VLNRFDTTNPVTEEAIVRVVGRPIFAKIPRDDRVIEKVQLRTHDLWRAAPNCALARAVEALARRLNARRDATAETAPGLFARLFGTLGARA
jgi:nitrogenase subunit NifH